MIKRRTSLLQHAFAVGRCALIGAACLLGIGSAFAQSTGGVSATLGLVYSSANADAQSLIRIYNGVSSTDWEHSGLAMTLTLRDGSTGNVVGEWTSPAIKAGVSQQFAISDIESGLYPGTEKPATYAITARAPKSGMAVQHIVRRGANGILTNMTDCDTGVAIPAKWLLNVHSSQVSGSYPSTVVITNTAAKPSSLTIELYDALAGYFMGSFHTPVIPADGHIIMSADAMETAAHITLGRAPNAPATTYVVRFGRTDDGGYNFTGFLQHLVNNIAAGVVTDLTAYCPLSSPDPPYRQDGILHTGPLFSGTQAGGISSLQIANTSTAAGTVTLTLEDATAGTALGQWTSPSIAAGTIIEIPMSTVESAVAVPSPKPAYYGLKVQSTFAGEIQHVLHAAADGTPSDLSTCDVGTGTATTHLNGVHTSRLNGTFPSTVVITNTAATGGPVTLTLYDAVTGTKLGSGATPSIPAGGHLSISSSALEAAAQVSPDATQLSYVVQTESTFTGFLQHLVTNADTGVVSDMTTKCQLQLAPSDEHQQPPVGATFADVPAGADLSNVPAWIDLNRLSPDLRNYILSLRKP